MPRPRTPIGEHGAIHTNLTPAGTYYARTRYRFPDGVTRLVGKTGTTPAAARAALLQYVADVRERGAVHGTADPTLEQLGGEYVESAPEHRDTFERYVLPRVGKLTVTEFTPQRATRLLVAVTAQHGAAAGRATRTVAAGVMDHAIRRGYTAHNSVTDERTTRP